MWVLYRVIYVPPEGGPLPGQRLTLASKGSWCCSLAFMPQNGKILDINSGIVKLFRGYGPQSCFLELVFGSENQIPKEVMFSPEPCELWAGHFATWILPFYKEGAWIQQGCSLPAVYVVWLHQRFWILSPLGLCPLCCLRGCRLCRPDSWMS